jgi:hypothetical protein
LFPCMPGPQVFTSGTHAYCLPSDCLQHHLSFGYKATNFTRQRTPQAYSHPKYSPCGQEIARDQNFPNVIASMLWSDDCDPQNSKKHLKALWVFTISFLQDEDVTTDTPIPTYRIAIGPKGADHWIVQKIILADPDL